jgi:hypothetical protein
LIRDGWQRCALRRHQLMLELSMFTVLANFKTDIPDAFIASSIALASWVRASMCAL